MLAEAMRRSDDPVAVAASLVRIDTGRRRTTASRHAVELRQRPQRRRPQRAGMVRSYRLSTTFRQGQKMINGVDFDRLLTAAVERPAGRSASFRCCALAWRFRC